MNTEVKAIPLSIAITVFIGLITTASGWIAYAQVLPERNMMVVAATTAREAKTIAERADRTAALNRQQLDMLAIAVDKAVTEIKSGQKDLADKVDRVIQGLNNIAAKVP